MKATFENTVQKLVTAFLRDELQHGRCSACAVGTILGSPLWGRHFITLRNEKGEVTRRLIAKDYEAVVQAYNDYFYIVNVCMLPVGVLKQWNDANKLMEQSGYTKLQLADVEFAFETADKGANNDEWMFNGLMAVVDVLAEIHGIDLKQKDEAKALFVKS